MSRRSHHPARRHARPNGEPRPGRPAPGSAAAPPARNGSPAGSRPAGPAGPAVPPQRAAAAPAPLHAVPDEVELAPPLAASDATDAVDREPQARAQADVIAEPPVGEHRSPATPIAAPPPRRGPAAPGSRPAANGHAPDVEAPDGDAERSGCTAPQLRRFIKSRAYVPMHELRRRFAINGGEDDVTAIELDSKARLYVGLPYREGRLLGELLRAGDIGYELSMDPITPVVVGVFPMRPVPRS